MLFKNRYCKFIRLDGSVCVCVKSVMGEGEDSVFHCDGRPSVI